MTKTKGKTIDELMKMTPEQEREYLDSIDPIHQGKNVKLEPVQKGARHLSLFTMRLDESDIGRLAALARKKHMKTTELARSFIIRGVEQDETVPSLEIRVDVIERRFDELARELRPAKKKSNVAKSMARV